VEHWPASLQAGEWSDPRSVVVLALCYSALCSFSPHWGFLNYGVGLVNDAGLPGWRCKGVVGNPSPLGRVLSWLPRLACLAHHDGATARLAGGFTRNFPGQRERLCKQEPDQFANFKQCGAMEPSPTGRRSLLGLRLCLMAGSVIQARGRWNGNKGLHALL